MSSIRKAAEKYGLPHGTLRDRKNGAQPRSVVREDQQHLTKMEEEAIVHWITRIDNYGWPTRVEYVKQMALGFIRSHGVRKPVLGKDWITRFLNHNP